MDTAAKRMVFFQGLGNNIPNSVLHDFYSLGIRNMLAESPMGDSYLLLHKTRNAWKLWNLPEFVQQPE